MSEKLTPNHLEVLSKLASEEEPIDYERFLPNLNPLLDLVENHLVRKKGQSYELSDLGKEYFNLILKYAEKYFERYKL
jgi:hypothetical protein